MRRIHIPNLFFVQGQAYQGKSTLTRHFRQSLDCEVVQTDQLFWRWCNKYHPKETRDARASLGKCFPHLPTKLRREWFEYLTNYVISVTKYARPDMVMEGWLLTQLPNDLKDVMRHYCTLMTVTMKKYEAYAANNVYKPNGRNYDYMVTALQSCMQTICQRDLMAQVKNQRFAAYKYCTGKSDCATHIVAFDLPLDMTGKSLLEIGCSTGYYSIYAALHGAKVWATDDDKETVRLASRISNSIYRLPRIRYYCGDIVTETFKIPRKFDYILISNLAVCKSPADLMRRARELLNNNGQLIVEAISDDTNNTPHMRSVNIRGTIRHCTNERTLRSLVSDLTLVKRNKSAPLSDSRLNRMAYTFSTEAINGLDDGIVLDTGDCAVGPQGPQRMVDPIPEPGPVVVPYTDPVPVRIIASDVNRRRPQFEELSSLESAC